MTQIVVTGGCGYIGSHIVKLLRENGENVVVYDNLSAGSPNVLPAGTELVVGDIRDTATLDDFFVGHQVEAVLHLAALVNAAESVAKSELYQAVNDLGSRQVWAAAQKAKVEIALYASSAAVYGTPKSRAPLQETIITRPTNPYGETKLAGEISLKESYVHTGSYGIFRFFNVAGAEKTGKLGQSKASRAIMQRLFAVAAGDAPEIIISGHDYDTKDGTVCRDFIHVEDIASAFMLGLVHLRHGDASFTCNLGLGRPTTMLELVGIVEAVTGKHLPIRYNDRMSGDIEYSLSDTTLAKKMLGWEPKYSIREMVEDGWKAYVYRK